MVCVLVIGHLVSGVTYFLHVQGGDIFGPEILASMFLQDAGINVSPWLHGTTHTTKL
jgi:hypothetical protein